MLTHSHTHSQSNLSRPVELTAGNRTDDLMIIGQPVLHFESWHTPCAQQWSSELNDLFYVPATPLTCSLEWWSFDCRMDWISLTSRDKVHLSVSAYLCSTWPTACTVSISPFVPVDDLLSAHEKPPVGSKEVAVYVSAAKDSDSDSCPSKTTSNQSSPLIIRGKGGKKGRRRLSHRDIHLTLGETENKRIS